MSCCNTGKITKKKIIVFSVIGITVVAASYFVFAATNNGAAFALPAILGFAACPAMCVAMGGVMWIAARFGSNKKQNDSKKESSKHHACCAEHEHKHKNENLEN